MNFLRRSVKSIYRQPIKSSILLLLLFLLGIMASGSISVRQAIINTEANLRRRMPAIATIMYDFDEDAKGGDGSIGECSQNEAKILTPELLRTIGSFPEVQAFDYSIDMSWGVTAPGMIAWQEVAIYSPRPLGYDEDLGMGLSVMGVSTVEFMEIRQAFLEVVNGRSFNSSEMIEFNEVSPVLITEGFAEVNNLDIGSYFEVQIVIFDYTEDANGLITEHRDRPPIIEETFFLEVIGIFNLMLPELTESTTDFDHFEASHRRMQAMHRVYVPNVTAEKMFNVRSQGWAQFDNFFFKIYFF